MLNVGRKRTAARANRNASGLLTHDDITRLNLISENFSGKCLRPTSYDLRLGEEYMSPGGDGDASQLLLEGHDLTIPKFSSVIICTHEIVQLPSNVAASFNLKIKMALRGLFVQMGTQVEPNYNGRLFALLQNISDAPIVLSPKNDDCRLLAIQFFYTSAPITPCENDFAPGIKIERIGQFITSSPIKGTINNITSDMEAAIRVLKTAQIKSSEEANQLRQNMDAMTKSVTEASTRIFQWKTVLIGGVLFAALAILVSVVAPIVTKVVYDGIVDARFASINKKVKELDARVGELSARRARSGASDSGTANSTVPQLRREGRVPKNNGRAERDIGQSGVPAR